MPSRSAARLNSVCDETNAHRVEGDPEDNRDVARGPLRRKSRESGTRQYQIGFECDQFCHKRVHAVCLAVCIADINDKIAALDPAEFPECVKESARRIGC